MRAAFSVLTDAFHYQGVRMDTLVLTDEVRAVLRERVRAGLEGRLARVAVDPRMLAALLKGEDDVRAISRGVAATNAQLRTANLQLTNELVLVNEALHEARNKAQVAMCRRYLLATRVGSMAATLRRLSRAFKASPATNTLAAPVAELAAAPRGGVVDGATMAT